MRKPFFCYKINNEKGATPFYLRQPRSRINSEQGMRRKNHKILDGLLKEGNPVGTNVEITLEENYRAGKFFEEGIGQGIYIPVFCQHNSYQENRIVQGKIESLDFQGFSTSTLFFLEYEKEKRLEVASTHIKNIRILN